MRMGSVDPRFQQHAPEILHTRPKAEYRTLAKGFECYLPDRKPLRNAEIHTADRQETGENRLRDQDQKGNQGEQEGHDALGVGDAEDQDDDQQPQVTAPGEGKRDTAHGKQQAEPAQ